MVFVLNDDGTPTMPTNRHGHVRILLKTKKAVVASTNPFTIRLTYHVTETQDITLGLDPGRTNIGICIINEKNKTLIAANVETRNKNIPKLIKHRKECRMKHRHLKRRTKRQRRAKANNTITKNGTIERHLPGYSENKSITCKWIKNKQARFNNRKRPENWLTPTANHLLQTHINIICKFAKILPITHVKIELNKFDFMRLNDPSTHGTDYQNGPLKGFDNSVKAAIYAQQSGKCLLCGNDITQYHHVIARAKNGSETIRNRVGLCDTCHDLAHKNQATASRLETLATGERKKYDAVGILNQIIPALLRKLSKNYQISITTGKETKEFREKFNLPKEHFVDAYAIACSNKTITTIHPPTYETHHLKQFRRHDREVCKREMVNRKYYLAGKLVATNRHKATAQTNDSLEEYIQKGGRTDNLTVKHTPPVMTDMNRILPGAQLQNKSTAKTLLKSASGYYYFDDNSRIWKQKTQIHRHNAGLVFVSNS